MSTEEEVLTLMSRDNQTFTVKKEAAIQSVTIKNMVEQNCASSVIPLFNIDSATLTLVIQILYKLKDAKGLVEEQELPVLFNLVNASSFLKIRDLMDMACAKVADLIKDKSVEEVREIFNITNDFTPEEEQAIRAEHAWAFEE